MLPLDWSPVPLEPNVVAPCGTERVVEMDADVRESDIVDVSQMCLAASSRVLDRDDVPCHSTVKLWLCYSKANYLPITTLGLFSARPGTGKL